MSDAVDAEVIEATVDVDDVIFALKMNNTNGADDRVIKVSRSGGEATIRRAFRGSERYANPANAPIHIRPESLVEDPWTRMPTRGEVDIGVLDVPAERHKRDDADEAKIDEAFEEILSVWEWDARRQATGEHEIDTEPPVKLTGVREDDDE
jgi:hypothetical protein